jgi:hypothetical protein
MSTQEPEAPRGQPYGVSGQQIARQHIQPIAGEPGVDSLGAGQLRGVMPGDIPSLQDPTAIPDEPIQTGLSTGPGLGPEVMGTADPNLQELSTLKQIFLRYPTEDLRRLIEWTESNLATPLSAVSPTDVGIPPVEFDEFEEVEDEDIAEMMAEEEESFTEDVDVEATQVEELPPAPTPI